MVDPDTQIELFGSRAVRIAHESAGGETPMPGCGSRGPIQKMLDCMFLVLDYMTKHSLMNCSGILFH